ncbi:hypothetical protein [Anaerovorax sp. IOR16]|uniref:hypothetical protein n=1 Tax=Anaerovorax sp. IOR16 TaxID=2773458 RepID=UPI0019CF5FB1|nr:hypothetical protein [Anaerovorax sp. IOR16]
MTNYKEIRKIEAIEIRGLCIRQNWYTMGSNEEYGDMLSNASKLKNVTTLDIMQIAYNFALHSELDADHTFKEFMENVAFHLIRISYTYVEEI